MLERLKKFHLDPTGENLEKQYLWEGHIFYSYVKCQKKKKKNIPGLDDDSESLLSLDAQCWGLPTMTTNTTFKSQHWKLDVWEEDTFGDQCVCSFKQPLVQKMSTKNELMTEASWVHLLAWYCIYCPCDFGYFFGENSVFNLMVFSMIFQFLSGCCGGDAL